MMTMEKIRYRDLARQIPTLFIFILLLLMAFPGAAQDNGASDDEVNAIAHKMYCPVCENIPLDVCSTQACADWRAEIRQQLDQGNTEQQIIDSFVARYGERVVGTPQDPFLRALSLMTPWLIGIVALLVAVLTFNRWRGSKVLLAGSSPQAGIPITDDADYRERLESDLKERR
jgi:cytochrome c-type biogenesis protein CcmH